MSNEDEDEDEVMEILINLLINLTVRRGGTVSEQHRRLEPTDLTRTPRSTAYS